MGNTTTMVATISACNYYCYCCCNGSERGSERLVIMVDLCDVSIILSVSVCLLYVHASHCSRWLSLYTVFEYDSMQIQ